EGQLTLLRERGSLAEGEPRRNAGSCPGALLQELPAGRRSHAAPLSGRDRRWTACTPGRGGCQRVSLVRSIPRGYALRRRVVPGPSDTHERSRVMATPTSASSSPPIAVPVIDAAAVYKEGFVAGILGALTVAVWFLIVDMLHGRPFHTPTVLGT